MDIELYNDIVHFINNFHGLSRDCLHEMEKIYSRIPLDTLASILNTRYQKKMMTNHGRVKGKRKEVIKKYEERITAGEEPGVIIRLAKQYDVTPALMAKVILEETMEKKCAKDEKTSQNPVSRNVIKEMFKDTTLIPEADLAYEVYLSIVFDNLYGPISDVSKRALGVEYELKLCHNVQQIGLSYKSESQLRAQGYDKTPDIKLDIPFAVDDFIVNWVESKAVFGDQRTHDQYIKDQYHSYWNRFGPGLVIYWFGYVETVPQPSEQRFIVLDRFPADVTLMDPNIIELPKLNI